MADGSHKGDIITSVPSELLIQIIDNLIEPGDVLRLGRTCKALQTITSSNDVWRSRVERLVNAHRRQEQKQCQQEWKATADLHVDESVYGRHIQSVLGRGARYLGWWATTLAYKGRLVRVSVSLDAASSAIASIVGEEVGCLNAFSSQALEAAGPDDSVAALKWKPLAAMWHGQGLLSYRLPSNHPSPDAGFSVDTLHPVLQYTPIFKMTSADEGFDLVSSLVDAPLPGSNLPDERAARSSPDGPGTLSPSLPIDLPLVHAYRRRFRDTGGSTEQAPMRYSSMETGPTFPSKDAVRGDALRSLAVWGEGVRKADDDGEGISIQGDYLTAPCFSLQARRDPTEPPLQQQAQHSNSMDYIFQERSETIVALHSDSGSDDDAIMPELEEAPAGNGYSQQHIPPTVFSVTGTGGNALFRAFLEGIGANLPPDIHENLVRQHQQQMQQHSPPIVGNGTGGAGSSRSGSTPAGDISMHQSPLPSPHEEEPELFYPINGPLHTGPLPSIPLSEPVLASSLKGMWVGCYSAHGYEFGTIALRNVWTRIHTADEVALEQIYGDEEGDHDGAYFDGAFDPRQNLNADPRMAREPLMPGLDGSLRRRRTVLEFIKLTGDVNVPAGQVSWVAMLPSASETSSSSSRPPAASRASSSSSAVPQSIARRSASPAATGSGLNSARISPHQQHVEPDLETLQLPTVRRADWQAWSDLPPHTARLSSIDTAPAPRWDEGSVQAAGRVAFTGFLDTRFIDAQATFVREDNGHVDEIRVKWHEMGKVSTFRRIRL